MPASRTRTHRRLPSPHRVKIHRNYTIGEAADLLGKHKNTVREWIRCGLPALAEQRPILILGRELRAYLSKRRKANKQPCGPGELYCLRCRAPRRPAGDMVDFQPMTPTNGNLVGFCPTCDSLMYRRVTTSKLDVVVCDLEVQITEGEQHIGECTNPSLSSDFKRSDRQ